MFGFFKNYSKVKVTSAAEALQEALARIDKDGVTEAGLLELDDKFRSLSTELVQERNRYEKEKKEADQVRELYDSRIAALGKLKAKLDADPTNTEITTAINTLLDALEESETDLHREQQEADQAKQDLDYIEAAFNELSLQIKAFRQTADKAKRDLTRAEHEKERAEEAEERAKRVAGLIKSSTSLNTAIDSMNRAAEHTRTQAEAARLRAQEYKGMARNAKVEETNPLIAEAMKADKLLVEDRLSKYLK